MTPPLSTSSAHADHNTFTSARASRFYRARRLSTVVHIGPLTIGGDHPLMIQSMCTTLTKDIAASVAQCIALAEHGCELIRLTAPGVADSKALKDIRAGLSAAGFAHIPLCADIHFMPAAALEAIEHVEKVRVNPGNYADKKSFTAISYSDAEYADELARISERFTPLVLRAKELGRCLRIGANHGSLSDRIMNRYGDSPTGMVASAMEFIHIAEANGFYNMVISMKSSNPKVMIHAYRLLCDELERHGRPYPLHLGVTEAGDGDDGRIKGACGIGGLLDDGIGDTIRVSLTEDPLAEIPVASALCALFSRTFAADTQVAPTLCADIAALNDHIDPLHYHRRKSASVMIEAFPCGNHHLPVVLSSHHASQDAALAADIQFNDAATYYTHLHAGDAVPNTSHQVILFNTDVPNLAAALRRSLASCTTAQVLGLTIAENSPLSASRCYRLLHALIEECIAHTDGYPRHPLCIHLREHSLLSAASSCGNLFADGIGDAIYLPNLENSVAMSYGILQAMKMRMTKTDYVACPSCGRTLFDLMQVSAAIKALTDHLTGVTIAIMGCIVNGPGEMADADFGYVGSGPGKITLYRGQDAVLKNIDTEHAPERLVKLIKESGRWLERDA